MNNLLTEHEYAYQKYQQALCPSTKEHWKHITRLLRDRHASHLWATIRSLKWDSEQKTNSRIISLHMQEFIRKTYKDKF